MAGSVHITSDFAETIRIDLDEKFGLAWNKKDFQFEKAYSVQEMEDPFVDDYMFQLPSEVDIVAEGGAYTRVNIEGIGTKRHTAFTLRTEMAYTQESVEDVKVKPLKDGAAALATALHRTIERLACRNISNAFTSVQSIDNLSVFNTAHPYQFATGTNPTTGSNRTNTIFNVENLKTAIKAFCKQRDRNGDPLHIMPNKILYGTDLQFDVPQVLKNQWETGTADRNMNVLPSLTPVMLHYFMDATFPNQWILLDDDYARLKFYWRMKPQSETAREEKTGNHLYRIRARIAYGWTDWTGSYGSTGEV